MGRLARKGKRLRPPSLRSGNRGRLFQPATMLRMSTRHLHGCANLEPYVAQVMPIVWPAIGKSGLDAVTAAYAVRPAMLVGLLQVRRRNQKRAVLDAAGSIQSANACAISAITSESLRPVRAGTWNE